MEDGKKRPPNFLNSKTEDNRPLFEIYENLYPSLEEEQPFTKKTSGNNIKYQGKASKQKKNKGK